MNCATDLLRSLWLWGCRLVVAVGMLLTSAIAVAATPPTESTTPTCVGRFPNPITDICWSCIFPIRVGGATLISQNQEDANTSGGSAFCACASTGVPKAGLVLDFWEPARIFEAVRTPHCYPSLGGIKLDPGFSAPEHAKTTTKDGKSAGSFYQAHWYTNPVMFWMEVMPDNSCLEQGSFDVAYAAEFDPLWGDSILSFFLAPDSALFANVIAKAACAVDCVAATAGFPLNTLFWCAGCQGSMYPLTGWVASHIGGVQASTLLMQRMTNKLHRQLLMWAGSGRDGLCTFYPQVVMDKTNYKSQMLFPIPSTTKINGRCCQPYGRSTVVWGSGKEFPYQGEDFTYQVFRKRGCCSGSSNWNMVTTP